MLFGSRSGEGISAEQAEAQQVLAEFSLLLDGVANSNRPSTQYSQDSAAEGWAYEERVPDEAQESGSWYEDEDRRLRPVPWYAKALVCVALTGFALGSLHQTAKGWPSFAETLADEAAPKDFGAHADGVQDTTPKDPITGTDRTYNYPDIVSSGSPEARSTTSTGEVLKVDNAEELLKAARDVGACETIELAPGRYEVASLRLEDVPSTADCPVTFRALDAVIVGTDPSKPAVVFKNAPYLQTSTLTIEGGVDSLQILDSNRVQITAIETSGAERAGIFISGSDDVSIPEGAVHTSQYGIVVGAFPEDMGTTLVQTTGVMLGEELNIYDTNNAPLISNAGASANYYRGLQLDAMMVDDPDGSCGIEEGRQNIWSDITCINPGGDAFRVRSNDHVNGSGEGSEFYNNVVLSDLPTPWTGKVVEIENGSPYDTTVVSCSNGMLPGSTSQISNKPCEN